MNSPVLSIIIVTRNSEKTLPKTLASIKKQNFPKENLEVLVIDGKSTDQTRPLVKKFGYKLVDNPQIGFVSGKHLGLLIAKGQYAMYLDSDEEIENPDSLKIKISAFLSNQTSLLLRNKKIRAVTSSGYKNPDNYPAISRYLNEFGDPFSYFFYKSTMNNKFFLKQLQKKYPTYSGNNNMVVFDFSKVKELPLLEFVEMGGMIDLTYFRKKFPQIKKDPVLIAHFLNLLVNKKDLVAVVKNDPIIHYSVDSFQKYLNKIAWRVRNNIYNKQSLALSGFEGRQEPKSGSFRKYLFIPYSLTLIFPTLDAIYLSITRKDLIFLIHPILCLYTVLLIIYHYLMSLLDIKPDLKIYGS